MAKKITNPAFCLKFPPSKHVEVKKDTTIKCEENKKKFLLNNPDKLKHHRVKIDNGLYTSAKFKKCDYLVVPCHKNEGYLVELKGYNFGDACEQIQSTISKLQEDSLLESHIVLHARIVLSGYGGGRTIANSESKKLRDILKKRNNGSNLSWKNSPYIEVI